jgi:hypothetical protein
LNRKRLRLSEVVVVWLATQAPLFAGALYVPAENGAQGITTRVWLTNNGSGVANGAVYLIPSSTDGTGRADGPEPTHFSVAPGRTLTLTPAPPGFEGLIEIDADPDLVVDARRVRRFQRPEEAVGAPVPVISSANAAAVNGLQTVQGWERTGGGEVVTNLRVINLGHAAARCTASAFAPTGKALAVVHLDEQAPLSLRSFDDALALLGEEEGRNRRIQVTCDQPFYVYSTVTDSEGGAIFLTPSQKGDSALRVPGASGCPPEAVCLAAEGLVHEPTPANPVGRVTFDTPPGTFHRIRLQMDVTVGDWYPNGPRGKHLIYWFVIDRNIDMPGMLFFRGPSSNIALVRHGIQLTHPEKGHITAPFAAQVGHTYHVDNDYDMGAGRYTVTITDSATGQVAASLADVPNVGQFTFQPGTPFLVDMGFPEGVIPDEVPSFGWRYEDVQVEVYP